MKNTSTNGLRFIYGDFNARLGLQRLGEEEIIGDYGFGLEARHVVEAPNRDLLMEFCAMNKYAVAQTFFQQDPENKVTYHEPKTTPMSVVSPAGFSMLDLLLVPRGSLGYVSDVWSTRLAALASHHFLVYSTLSVQLDVPLRICRRAALDWKALTQPAIQNRFVELVGHGLPSLQGNILQNEVWANACQVVQQAAHSVLPAQPKKPNKPWISQATLDVIARKRTARASGDWQTEKTLRKQVHVLKKIGRNGWRTLEPKVTGELCDTCAENKTIIKGVCTIQQELQSLLKTVLQPSLDTWRKFSGLSGM